jgi:uncharacterized protein YqjF (DUF2071 family)
MYQSWHDLLFAHWAVDAGLLRKYIPEPLQIDAFDGEAYVSITPLTMANVRPIFVPPLPLVSYFYEVNFRTYVYHDDVPGVWFFSLDANALLPVVAARIAYHLPYYYSSITAANENERRSYGLRRSGDRPASLRAAWTSQGEPHHAEPGTLEFFLTERYYLFAASGPAVYRSRIWHKPWPLRPAQLEEFDTTLFDLIGLAAPAAEPLVAEGGPVDVEVWPLERVV